MGQPPAPARTWLQQLTAMADAMAVGRKYASTDAVAQYYKQQRKRVRSMIKLNAMQQRSEFGFARAAEGDGGGAAAATEPLPDGAAVEVGNARATGETVEEDDDDDPDEKGESEGESVGARLSLLLNVVLLGLKIYAAVHSGSLTVIASLVDSALDLFSGGVLVFVEWLVANADTDKFPTGTHHHQPLGVLIFSVTMFVASAKLIEDSATKLADPSSI